MDDTFNHLGGSTADNATFNSGSDLRPDGRARPETPEDGGPPAGSYAAVAKDRWERHREGVRYSNEEPLYPKKLKPFPGVFWLMKLPREEQERWLERRATELLLEIEGLRYGFYIAPHPRSSRDMLQLARRRFRRLRDTAMKLGFWTDGRWDAGEEETHLV